MQFPPLRLPQKPIHLNSSPTLIDIEQWLEALHRSDRSLYNMMAMEVWSMAKTMDDLFPGFWNQFMSNRRVAMQEFKEQRQLARSHKKAAPTADQESVKARNR